MKTLVAAFAFVFAATTSFAQDVLSLANTAAESGSTVSLAVGLQDVAGTPLGNDAGIGKRIQGIAFRVTYDPAQVVSVTFERAGILWNLTPLFERTATATGSFAYLGSFDESAQPIPATIAAIGGARIGTLRVELASALEDGAAVPVTFDPVTTALANQAGTIIEQPYNRKLALSSATITIGGAATTTALASSSNPSTTGQSVTFTATVTSETVGAIGGSMTFYDGSSPIGFANVVSGSATFTTSSLSVGSHSIQAVFEGGEGYLASASQVVTQTVNHVLDAPAGLIANATSATSVALSWNAVSGASSYEIRRRSNDAYSLVGTSAVPSFTDNTAVPSTTYLYVVRALNANGSSPDSAPDLATTIVFTDDPLVPTATTIKATHIVELRSAVNAMRAAANQPPLTFTDPSLGGQTVRRVHVQELRSAIGTARSLLGLATPAFSDATLTTQMRIKAAHIAELRNAVR